MSWRTTHQHTRAPPKSERPQKVEEVKAMESPTPQPCNGEEKGTSSKYSRDVLNSWAREGRVRRLYIAAGYEAGVRYDPYQRIYHMSGEGVALSIKEVATVCKTTETVLMRYKEIIQSSPEFTIEDFVQKRMRPLEGGEIIGRSLMQVWARDVGVEFADVDRNGYYQRLYDCLGKGGIEAVKPSGSQNLTIQGYTLIPDTLAYTIPPHRGIYTPRDPHICL